MVAFDSHERTRGDDARTTEQNGQTGDDVDPDGGSSGVGGAGGFYSTREDAIAYVGSFAGDEAAPVGTDGSGGPRTIAFSTSSAGSSGTNGPNGSSIHSDDMHVVPDDGGTIAFGGDVGRSLRVRNHATAEPLTFEPASGAETYAVEEFEIETEGEGVLEEDTPRLTPRGEEHDVGIDGTWRGDRSLFEHQTFARYSVELVEARNVVGETGGKVVGKGYQWGFAQTTTAAFVTRQPPVRADWHVEFYVGHSHEPLATQVVDHLAAEGVFEVDLTALDVEPGQHGWELRITESPEVEGLERVLSIRGSPNDSILIA